MVSRKTGQRQIDLISEFQGQHTSGRMLYKPKYIYIYLSLNCVAFPQKIKSSLEHYRFKKDCFVYNCKHFPKVPKF